MFAAADPFVGSAPPFLGIDGFNPAGPMPLASPMQQTTIEASCLDVHRSLSVFLDGELAIPQAQAVSTHLTACGPCQSAQAFQMQLRTTVAAHALQPMPEDVRARITKALGFE